MQCLAGLMPSILQVLHLMLRRAGGCLAAKSAMAHASANSTFERKNPFSPWVLGFPGYNSFAAYKT